MNTSISLLFAGFLILSRFVPNVPNPDHVLNPNKEYLTRTFSSVCMSILSHPKLKDVNVNLLVEMIEALSKSPNWKPRRLLANIDMPKMFSLYRGLCRPDPDPSVLDGIDVNAIFQTYYELKKDLPDLQPLKSFKLKSRARVYAQDGSLIGELYDSQNRREWIPLSDIPPHVVQAFIAAEDKDFFYHHGVDQFGVVRAFGKYITSKGRPEGGSTITQQVAKNLFTGDEISLERKFREMLIAEKIEQQFSKFEILEIYLNMVFMGRSSWGVKLAAYEYFHKTPQQLTLQEAALLAGINKGPNYYNPSTKPERVKERINQVLKRMADDKYITEEQAQQAAQSPIQVVPPTAIPNLAPYFLDALQQVDAKKLQAVHQQSGDVQVFSTIDKDLQSLVTRELQIGLLEYEKRMGRYRWRGPIMNVKNQLDAIGAAEVTKPSNGNGEESTSPPDWELVLSKQTQPTDLPWQIALVLSTGNPSLVGLADGSVRVLRIRGIPGVRLARGDLVFVSLDEHKAVFLEQPPQVQGAVVIIDHRTGAVRALTGGFSYSTSKFNRAVNGFRQPGSALKPFTYLAALENGYSKASVLKDMPISFPPIAYRGKWWTPRNYDRRFRGTITLQRALEESRNVPTARLMQDIGLDAIRNLTQALGIYDHPERYYPFILGSQPTSVLRLTAAYGMIGNGGVKIVPTLVSSITNSSGAQLFNIDDMRNGYQRQIEGVSPEAAHELRQILQGVVARGTASQMRDLADSVAGKTGTSDDEKDAWFVGFTDSLAIGVFVGYDNKDRRTAKTLGPGQTGSRVALPIFSRIVRQIFENHSRRQPFSP